MRPYWMPNRTKTIIASLAAAAVLTGPVIANKLAFAENTDEVGMDEGANLIQPSEPYPGYILPPLSDHLMIAQLNDGEVALEEDEDVGALEENDGTAKGYNRGYYAEPAQIVRFVLAPTSLEAIEVSEGSEDGTAQQYDRGYYKDPEIIIALVIVQSEDIEED